MLKEGVYEYTFDNIDPGTWALNHSYGPVLWAGELTEAQLISNSPNPQPTLKVDLLTLMGTGTQVTNKLTMKVIPGPKAGKVVVEIVPEHRNL